MSEVLHIDWTRCDGRGLCTELLPTVLERDQWGYPLAKRAHTGDRSNVTIGPAHSDAAREAIHLCPKLALSLTVQTQRPPLRQRRFGWLTHVFARDGA